jgi:LPPG:FO 2-phospho-L-lactate transferase
MTELGLVPGPATVAAHYGDLIDGMMLDCADAAEAGGIRVPTRAEPILMSNLTDRKRVAAAAQAFARALGGRR